MQMGLSQFDVLCKHNDREPNVGCSGFDGTEDTFEPSWGPDGDVTIGASVVEPPSAQKDSA
jgi:hypothetical protein